ncbi:hypothetical protein [Gemmata sp.]|uniref:tetratricopeptide repeat protein n=1 Tax=Gemmata sp. TaxID=1914242 RepID=UPI003F70CFAF
MANNPNENDPKPVDPRDEADLPPLPEDDPADEVRIENLPDLGPVDLAELSGDLPPDELGQEGEVWSERAPHLDPTHAALPDFDAGPDLAPSLKDPSSFTEAGLVDLPELPDAVENDSANLFRPPANPVPPPVEVDAARGPDSGAGTAPVAPASGWFDANELNRLPDPRLNADAGLSDSDLFGSPPDKANRAGELLNFIEGSDIFSGGPVPDADLAATSDVLLGAALDYAADNNLPLPPEHAAPAGSPSELTLGVMPAPESEPVLEVVPPELRSGDEPVFEDDSLFDGLDSDAPVPTDHFSSGDALAPLPPDTGSPEAEAHSPTQPQRIKPLRPDDTDLRELGLTPDFGATPRATPDASSILADLSSMGGDRYDGASEVRLDAPGFERTVGGENDGSEFGLELPPEMRDGPQAPDSASIVWSVHPGDVGAEGEVSHDAGTVPEVSLEDDDGDLMAPPPKKPLDPTEPVRPLPAAVDEGDSSVEFSDFPSAEDESTASQFFGKLASDRSKLPVTEEHAVPSVDDLMPAEWTTSTSSAEIDLPELDDVPPARGSKPTIAGLAGTQIRRPTPGPGELPPVGGTGPIPSLPKPGAKAPSKSGEPSTASVELDWVSGSMPQMPVSATGSAVGPVAVANWESESMVQRGPAAAPAEPEPEEYAEPARGDSDDGLYTKRTKPDLSVRPEPRRGGKGGWVGGTLVGAVLAGGGFAGAYFGGFLPPPDRGAQVAPPGKKGGDAGDTDPDPKAPGHAAVAAAVRSGDAAAAKKLAAAIKDPSPVAKAAQGEAELFAVVQENKDSAAMTIAPNSPGMQAAANKLQAAISDLEKVNTPEAERAAVKATLHLGIVYQLGGEEKKAERLYQNAKGNYPRYASTFDAALDRLDESRPPAPPAVPDGNSRRVPPTDARELLLAAVVLLQDEPPAKEKEEDVEAGVYFWKAVRLARNEKYTEAIEVIAKARATHIKQARAAAGRGLNPLSDPLEQIFTRSCDDLKAFWELQAAIAENATVAEAFKKDGALKALGELEKKAAGAVKLMTDLKDASEKLTVASKELKDAAEKVEKLTKDAKEAEEAKVAVEKKLEAEEKGRKGAEEVVMGVVKELQAAKLLPEKYDTAELLAAQKRALDRATGPALSSLLSSEMMAVAGFGLTAGQLVDLADRLTRAERTAKTATDKLATEVKKLTAEHGEAMKKLADEHATAVSKLKDDQTADLKKAADTYAADAKKLTDGFEAKVKALDAAVAAEKKRTDEVAAKFKADLGNAVTPAQAIDLWLPLLVELRRPADSEGALAAAAKSLTTSAPDSEDVGKARTVAGLALLFQNKLAEAKAQFQAAITNPNYEAALAAKKQWATAAEVGLQSVTDPLAAYRRAPVLPARNPAAAARSLDAGIAAFKTGRLKDAVASLTDATKADATDAVSWYFLGAAKLSLGQLDQGKDDIRQGAAREAVSNVPTHLINAALSPIQGPARDAITASRPEPADLARGGREPPESLVPTTTRGAHAPRSPFYSRSQSINCPFAPAAAASRPFADTASACTRGSPHFHTVSTSPLATSRSSTRLFSPRTSIRRPHGSRANGGVSVSGCGVVGMTIAHGSSIGTGRGASVPAPRAFRDRGSVRNTLRTNRPIASRSCLGAAAGTGAGSSIAAGAGIAVARS